MPARRRSRARWRSPATGWPHSARSWRGFLLARIPAVKARQIYVAEFIDTFIGLRGKTLCDIGGGEGQFLEIVKAPDYGAEVFTIEPSPSNCAAMRERGVEAFQGTIEDFLADAPGLERRFDIVSIMWTLENCRSCRSMLDGAYELLKDGGHILVATGSRIL
ncbi:MAG: methyltransferase domain-containing protein, partial [Alphaproteobacteria bacterium]|nr:methyltransferase domain-containing protein [Alphaproteobacteria bacterium]